MTVLPAVCTAESVSPESVLPAACTADPAELARSVTVLPTVCTVDAAELLKSVTVPPTVCRADRAESVSPPSVLPAACAPEPVRLLGTFATGLDAFVEAVTAEAVAAVTAGAAELVSDTAG